MNMVKNVSSLCRICAILMVLAALCAVYSMEAEARAEAGLQDALEQPYPAPEFAGIAAWINSDPLTMRSLKGKVVLIDFWAYSCVNCVRTLPVLEQWDSEYRDKGLVIIGVHTPEFEFEKKVDNVKHAVTHRHIGYPVALDNDRATWDAFKNHYWPAHYLVDKQGRVVYTHFGEGHYAQTENNIRVLLGMDAKADMTPDTVVSTHGQTPETYLGSERGERFDSPQKLEAGIHDFRLPQDLPEHHWALSGPWKVEEQRIIAKKAGAKLRLHFTAGKVFLVLGAPEGKPVKATLTLDGKPLDKAAGKDASGGIVTVDRHALYELVSQDSVRSGVLEISADSPGLEAYAFTFGK